MTSYRLLLTTAAAIALASPLAVSAQDVSGPVIATDRGKVRGTVADGVTSWKGIPFAAAPVGALRWRAPQPAPAWQGIRAADAYAHDCMQVPFPSDAAPLGTQPAEDCLYVNVWKPAASAAAKLPVIVWIYGGGFVNGGASPPTYAGAGLARQGVVFVSFNYRVGRFGTFALPQLTKENANGGRVGNYGIMDQIAALEWVKRNAAAFGGDPSNVTIIGESAGGMSVHMLNTSPLAHGLFAKAFVMSGGNGQSDNRTLADVERIGADFARSQRIDPTAPDAVAKLRALSAEQVTDGLSMVQLFRPKPGPVTHAAPFVDGKLVVNLGDAYAAGRFARVPIVVGATDADMGGKTGFMLAGARQAAAAIADRGVPVWEYRFAYVADSVGKPGAQHATDIPFFFDTTAIKYGAATTPKDIAVGNMVSRYIVNFAKTGNPNGPGLPAWPAYTRTGDQLMEFGADGKAIAKKDPWGAEMDAAKTAQDPARTP